jgi:hypothetical protein
MSTTTDGAGVDAENNGKQGSAMVRLFHLCAVCKLCNIIVQTFVSIFVAENNRVSFA